MTIGQQIKNARKAKGYNQTKLAHKLHISRGTLSRIENDKKEVTEDFLNELRIALYSRSGSAYPGSGGGACYSPAPSRFERRIAEDDYPCRHCCYNSANRAFDTGESRCEICHYNRRKTNRQTAVTVIK